MSQPSVAIVGGGASGLAAAHFLAARSSAQIELFEASPRLGGRVLTQDLQGAPVEAGPDGFVVAPELMGLCEELGLGPELVAPATTQAYLLEDGRLRALQPEDMRRLTGGGPVEFRCLRGGLGRLIEELERRTPRLRVHLGTAVTGLQPLPGGGFALRTAVDGSLGADGGSLAVNGGRVRARRGSLGADGANLPMDGGTRLTAGGGSPRADGGSLRADSGSVGADGGSSRGDGESLRPDGGTFRTTDGGSLRFPDSENQPTAPGRSPRPLNGESPRRAAAEDQSSAGGGGDASPAQVATLHADAVVLAVPAASAARLLAGPAPAAAAALAAIRFLDLGVISLLYRGKPWSLSGSGFLARERPGWLMSGCTWLSEKWPHLASADHTLMRPTVGGSGGREWADLDDAALVAEVHRELTAVLGPAPAPEASRVVRWAGAVIDHHHRNPDLLPQARAALRAVPGLQLAAGSYTGHGLAACVAEAARQAEAVAAGLRAGFAGSI